MGALDGVRAIAVAAVVLYHGGVSWLRGGFLGVDVFFVLSGFLITSLLLTELEGTGRVRLLRFYERRARRLLPALVVLVLLVAAFAYLVVPHGSYPSLPRQIVGTMLYVGNWTLIAGHAGYFTLGLPPSPLQHTWSLAIEEQFYLVWPALLFGLTRLVRTRRSMAAWCALGAAATMAITAGQFESGSSPNALYFATQTHATTLLLGCAGACLLLRGRGREGGSPFATAPPSRRRLVDALGALAWAGVLVAFLEVRGTGSFLYRGGYLAVGLVVLVAIGAAVASPEGPVARVLALGPVAYLGRISYGVYLYHFPLFIWLDAERTHLHGVALLALRIAATLLVASLSYAVVEQPVRRRRMLRGRVGLLGAVAGFTACGVLAFSATSAATAVPFADHISRWNPVKHVPAGTTATVLLVGDSMGWTLGAGLNNPFTAAEHLFFAVNSVGECSLVPGELDIKQFRIHQPRRCASSGPHGWPARWRHSLAKYRPALSMVLFRMNIVDHHLDGRWQHIGQRQYDCVLYDNLVRAAAVLSSGGRPVVLLTTPYFDTGEQPNGDGWPEDAPSRVQRYNQMLRALAAAVPGVIHVVDLAAWIDPGGHFTRTIGTSVVRWVDGVHFTYAGDAYVLPRLLAAIRPLLDSRPPRVQLFALQVAAQRDQPSACRGPAPG